jgi:hypothetical protein
MSAHGLAAPCAGCSAGARQRRCCGGGIVAAAVGANIAGIYLVGSVAGWERWLAAAGYFFVWRLCLYGATAYGWVWMRRRLLAREDDAQARRRLMRSEIAGVVAIVALEASLLMQG